MRALRFVATTAGAIVITGGVAAGAYWAGTTSVAPHPPVAPPPALTRSPSQPSAPAAAPAPVATPEAAATAWMQAVNTLSWRDPSPAAWVDRATPYLTGEAARGAEQARTGTVGPDWHRFVEARCTQRVASLGSVVPPEAPRTDTVVYVQVSATAIQDCAAGPAPAGQQSLAATVEVSRGNDGIWRVSRGLF